MHIAMRRLEIATDAGVRRARRDKGRTGSMACHFSTARKASAEIKNVLKRAMIVPSVHAHSDPSDLRDAVLSEKPSRRLPTARASSRLPR